MGVFDLGYCYARAVYTLIFLHKKPLVCFLSGRGFILWHGFSVPICRICGAEDAVSYSHVSGLPDSCSVFWYICLPAERLFL